VSLTDREAVLIRGYRALTHRTRCPGWWVALDGTIKGCTHCKLDMGQVRARSFKFFTRERGRACPGCERTRCPGLGVYTSSTGGFIRNPHIERHDDCAIYSSDEEATKYAIAMYEEAGYMSNEERECS
jgi:hypothetical protein